uniref:Cyclic AMP-dependent transcription factor ATF-5 n=2 Tax=Ictalurus punctatus TaxID=7998 RepID=W5UL40_ICTPU
MFTLSFSDWMTEHFDTYPLSASTESSPGSSIPPSPLEHDVQVPSDLEVMTSLLKEELAQLEDYYLFESTPMKADKWQKCDKGYQAMSAPSYYQLPCTSYNVNQSESNPRLVTLATGELDLRGFCGSSVGRAKTSRPAPYSYVRTHSTSQRIASNGCKDVEVFEKETWTFKGTHSGYAEIDQCAVDKIFGKNHIGTKKVRECAILLKEEEKRCFTEDVFYRAEMVKSFDAGAPLDAQHRREGQVPGMKMLGHGHEAVAMPVLHCSENGSSPAFKHPEVAECYFSQITANLEPYHGFMNEVDPSVRSGAVESMNNGYSSHECLVDQSFEYLSGDSVGSSLEFPAQKPMQRLRENLCVFKPEVKVSCLERNHGERKQKKRDQNKTAAYRYRQRKRAEQDCLEEELHGLEGRNRELRDKAESVEREIQYVKDLLIEVYKARSQRHKDDSSA